MNNVPVIALMLVVAASACDVLGNVMTKLSDGFRHKLLAVAVMVVQIAAFGFLALAIRHIDLSVAYAVWGGLGIIATAIIGRLFFHETLHPVKVLGIAFTLGGLVAMKLAI